MRHRICISFAVGPPHVFAGRLIKKSVRAVLESENVLVPCEVNVLLVDDAAIKDLNARFRNVDKPTDVLSFPLLELKAGKPPCESELDPGDRRCHIGDIVISVQRVKAQAEEFGHGVKRELSYLTVHSVLHLLGYDHVDEGEGKTLMREREERALALRGRDEN